MPPRVPRTHTRRSPNVSRVIPARLRPESADHPPFSTSTVSHLRNGSACPCPRSPKRELRPLFPPRSISSSLPAAGAAWPSPRGNLFPTSFLSGDFPFPGTLAGSLGPTPGPPLLSRLTFRSPLYIVCASFSPGRPQNLSPEFLPCPRPLLAAVGDAVPSARQCPRPWLALYETLSRARAAGMHPSFQPRS